MITVWYLALSITILLLDRISKSFVLHHPPFAISSWLSVYPSFNKGLAWGIFNSDSSYITHTLSGIIILFTLFFAYYTWKQAEHGYVIGEVMVLAGAVSNSIDRFLYGGVLDFITLHNNFQVIWPSFNIADAAIVVGVLLMLISSCRTSA